MSIDPILPKISTLNLANITSLLRALKVCLDYGYEVEFSGVGQAPPGYQNVGFCSQIGVFHRLGVSEVCNTLCSTDAEDVSSYTLVSDLVYTIIKTIFSLNISAKRFSIYFLIFAKPTTIIFFNSTYFRTNLQFKFFVSILAV